MTTLVVNALAVRRETLQYFVGSVIEAGFAICATDGQSAV